MTWTNDRVSKLKQMWNDGMSAYCIAKELGNGLTRNGVIGKVHRLGISRSTVDTQAEISTLRAENEKLRDALRDLHMWALQDYDHDEPVMIKAKDALK